MIVFEEKMKKKKCDSQMIQRGERIRVLFSKSAQMWKIKGPIVLCSEDEDKAGNAKRRC